MDKFITKFNNSINTIAEKTWQRKTLNNTYLIDYSRDNYSILRKLELEGYIRIINIKKLKNGRAIEKKIEIRPINNILINKDNRDLSDSLEYTRLKLKIKQLSKSGRRIYISGKKDGYMVNKTKFKSLAGAKFSSKIGIKTLNSHSNPYNSHIYLIRTSKGIMTDKDIKLHNIGGELLLKISFLYTK